MSERDTIDDANDNHAMDGCTTTESFDDHGIDDGTDLVTDTYHWLRAADETYEPTAVFFDRLAEAFAEAYLAAVEDGVVPTHVELAIEDARELTREEFADRPDADLRTDVIPAFYRRVAGFHCIYRETVAVG